MASDSIAEIVTLLEKGHAGPAEVLSRARIADSPNDPVLHALLASALVPQDRLREAAELYERALIINPAYTAAFTNLIQVLVNDNRFDHAIEYCRTAHLRSPRDVSILEALAMLLSQTWRKDEALAVYRKILAIDPSNRDALHNLGATFANMNQPQEALVAFNQILGTHPEDVGALLNLGLVLASLGRDDDAAVNFCKALTTALNAEQLLGIIRWLGNLDKINDATARVVHQGRTYTISDLTSYAQAHPSQVVASMPAVQTADGVRSVNMSEGTEQLLAPVQGLSTYLLKIPDWEMLPSNLLFTEDTFIDSNNVLGSLEIVGHLGYNYAFDPAQEAGKILFRTKALSRRLEIKEAAGVLSAIPNYSAWVLGELPRLALYARASPDLPIILHGDVKAFHLDSLRCCGVEANRLICVDANTSLYGPTLFYAEPTYFRHRMSFGCFDILRNIPKALPARSSRRRSIYVSRSRLGADAHRRIRNEDEIETTLRENGFEILHPQEMTFSEQVSAFAEAERIVGPFGAALANAVFCRSDVKICILDTKSTPEFVRLLQWLRIDTFHVNAQRHLARLSGAKSVAFEFSINVADLRDFLSRSS